jgi:integral membrane sensor domain MASE1
MLFGWRGLIGLVIAVTAIGFSKLVAEIDRIDYAFLAAIVRASSIWLALEVYGRVTNIKSPWDGLTWIPVPFLAVFVSVTTATAVSLLFVSFGIEQMDSFVRNVTAWVLGDTVGTVIVLVIVINLRQSYLRWRSKPKD